MGHRIRMLEYERQKCQEKALRGRAILEEAQARLVKAQQELPETRQVLVQYETEYRERQRRERSYSALAKARQRVRMLERRAQQILVLEKRLQPRQRQMFALQAQIQHLSDRFQFQIFEEGRGHLIDFPNDTTRLCAELLDKLKAAVGEENMRIEPILYQ
ncbi:MAG: hypothetical protein JXB85_17515 [Anaerolineales bacterium]|nr:hypothetical protein [Anaerolineales bacterium]